MEIFNSIDEMCAYYNEKTNTYEFIKSRFPMDIELTFNLSTDANLIAGDIKAMDINARDISAFDINAQNIKAWDIKAMDINAMNIKAWDIKAWEINARNIKFDAVCWACNSFICNSVRGGRENSKCFCLDNEVIIKNRR